VSAADNIRPTSGHEGFDSPGRPAGPGPGGQDTDTASSVLDPRILALREMAYDEGRTDKAFVCGVLSLADGTCGAARDLALGYFKAGTRRMPPVSPAFMRAVIYAASRAGGVLNGELRFRAAADEINLLAISWGKKDVWMDVGRRASAPTSITRRVLRARFQDGEMTGAWAGSDSGGLLLRHQGRIWDDIRRMAAAWDVITGGRLTWHLYHSRYGASEHGLEGRVQVQEIARVLRRIAEGLWLPYAPPPFVAPEPRGDLVLSALGFRSAPPANGVIGECVKAALGLLERGDLLGLLGCDIPGARQIKARALSGGPHAHELSLKAWSLTALVRSPRPAEERWLNGQWWLKVQGRERLGCKEEIAGHLTAWLREGRAP
jgi:hypothetical protein